jgi:hypothetical protein
MFEWIKKQPVTVVTKAVKGFFNSESNVHSTTTALAIKQQEILRKTFQRDASHFVTVNPDGSKYAMDDALSQPIPLKIGLIDNIPAVQLEYYASQGFIGWQACAMLDQNWLIRKACTMPAKDATRNGYEITSNDGTEIEPEILDFIRQRDKHYGIKKHCVDFVAKGRVFGIRIALFHVDSTDPDYYVKPFNPDGIRPGSYRGISLIDPTWVTPELDFYATANPASQHFYEPTWWRINAQRIHRTHLIIFRNGSLPDILKPTYFYGGIPVPQMIMERVYAAERTANEAPMLAMSKRLTVLKCDTTKIIENPEAFIAQAQIWTNLQNNFGFKVVGGDEEITQFDTSLSELDAVIMTQYQLVAAGAGVPATKLLGTSPKGFNATGEFEEASYHEELESIQEHDLSPLVERHHLLLIRSEVAPKFKIKPFATEVNWNPVDSPTAAELADINLKKAQTDTALSAAGAVDGYDIRGRLIADKDSGYNGMELEVDRELETDEEQIAGAKEA